ncbi:hypothetical protein D8M04_03250 [Oceanobacillus piezotolerans]|uniref:Spore coat protein n=1 Tax=Oceanobacillus piezotolerans TaxID=2448030 RepID=A0A498DAE1_9BACI|nr:hypothetical protein [Oceanobacillus piezotolerans]RLL48303.1 hypothetical protein D8M04_03250 [Oceanobacillus piezotolerans]
MAKKKYAPHEVLEVHEVLTVKTASAAKSSMMQGLVADKELRKLLEEDVKASQKAIDELKGILEEADKEAI